VLQRVAVVEEEEEKKTFPAEILVALSPYLAGPLVRLHIWKDHCRLDGLDRYTVLDVAVKNPEPDQVEGVPVG